MEHKTQIPQLQTRAHFEPATVKEDDRTIELVWTTGARVRRNSYFSGPWIEDLSLDPNHCDLSRLNGGAPLLNTHSSYALSDQMGVVEKAWIVSPTEARALVRFSKRADVEPFFQDVKDGIIRNVSVGYAVRKFVEVERVDDVPVMRAEDWTPFEISLVPIPADPKAGVRNDEKTFDCLFVRSDNTATNGGATVEKVESTEVGTAEPAAPNVNPTEGTEVQPDPEVQRKAADVERTRASEILNACRDAGMIDLAPEFVSKGETVDAVRSQLIKKLAERNPAVSNIQITRDENQTRAEAIENSLMVRFDSKIQLMEPARRYRSATLVDLARECLSMRGERVEELSRHEIATRAMLGTTEFPKILANVAAKSLRNAYEAAPQYWRAFIREVELSDFKPVSRNNLSGLKLDKITDKIAEKGSYTEGTLTETGEQYGLATYGKILNISRQAIINDDMSAFTRIPSIYGRACAELESDLVIGILTANAAMSDTFALFHANHTNLGTAAALSETSLTEARKMMRLQKGLANEMLNLMPRFLVVPAALETTARKLVASITPTQSSAVNPFGGSLDLIVDPRLDAASAISWYMVADPAQIDTIELAYLSGQRGVYLEPYTDYTTDGFKMKVRLDVAASPIDHRGMFKNAGL
jgi:hypothetical protein